MSTIFRRFLTPYIPEVLFYIKKMLYNFFLPLFYWYNLWTSAKVSKVFRLYYSFWIALLAIYIESIDSMRQNYNFFNLEAKLNLSSLKLSLDDSDLSFIRNGIFDKNQKSLLKLSYRGITMCNRLQLRLANEVIQSNHSFSQAFFHWLQSKFPS